MTDHQATTPQRRARWLLPLASLATVSAIGAQQAAEAGPPTPTTPDTAVVHWDAIGTQAFSAAALSPAEGHTIFAYVGIAVYDAVVAIEGGYEPFMVDLDAPEDASTDAAVAAAASTVLRHYLPAQAAFVDGAYATALASIPDGEAEDDGVAVGTAVADAVIAERADDGFRAPATYTPLPVPGAWIPTGPTPIGVYLGDVEPFSLASADQFRPDGPPALGSPQWAKEYDEVREVGSSTSTVRTADQTLAARFWGEPPVQQARGSFRRFVVDHGLDVVDAARFMAMQSVTYADALIACFDAKYHYAFWRPVTAIRAGDTDGNDATVGDPAWSPLLPATPNHPEYPSAHSCITPAGARVAAAFLRTQRIRFTVPSLSGLGDRYYATVAALEHEVTDARVWGGIHFRSAVDDGAGIAKDVARWVLDRHFHPVD